MVRQLSTKVLMVLIALLIITSTIGTLAVMRQLQDMRNMYQIQAREKMRSSVGEVTLNVIESEPPKPTVPVGLSGRVTLTVI
ncbi:hypothetical protein HYS48_01730 [Candidatus Woesearchaeota archaeon]|nr:hypothetical protein [Candidatus Woesearchaeota archaeon]